MSLYFVIDEVYTEKSGHTPSAKREWLANYTLRVERAVAAFPALRCLPTLSLRSAVGTLSLSTRATVPQPGLFSCAFVNKLEYWLVCVMSVDKSYCE